MDRRKEKRIKIKKIVRINNEPCIMLDISRNGMKVSADKIPSVSEVEITLVVENKVISLKGKIRWKSEENPLSTLKDMGISIEDATEEYYQFFDNLSKINASTH